MTDPAEEERELRGLAASSALELVSTSYLAVEPDISGDIDDYSTDYALDVKGFLRAVKRAATEAESQLDQFIATKLEGVQYYRHRDQIVKVGGSGTWKVKDDVVNDGTLAEYIGSDWPQVVNLKAQGTVTKSRIEELERATIRSLMPDADDKTVEKYVEEVRRQYFKYDRNDSAISTMPPDKAPKKAQALEHGQSIAAKPRLEAGE